MRLKLGLYPLVFDFVPCLLDIDPLDVLQVVVFTLAILKLSVNFYVWQQLRFFWAHFVLQLLQEYLIKCLVDVVHLDFIGIFGAELLLLSYTHFGGRGALLVFDVFHLMHY
jgi:hypothetical protein